MGGTIIRTFFRSSFVALDILGFSDMLDSDNEKGERRAVGFEEKDRD